jgi:AAA family ATP:ADP antiporter
MKKKLLESLRSLRSFIWPIYGSEHKKFIPMLVIFFLVYFNYNLLRAAKDTLIVTAPDSGAEAIPFIKVWVVLPMAFFFTYVFAKLSSKFNREKVIYIMLSIFLAFFFIFAFFLYPARDLLHPTHLAKILAHNLPTGFKGLIAIFQNWTLTLFYVMSEEWSTIISTVLIWGFANEVTSVLEAKRFYALFGLGANVATIVSGEAATHLSHHVYNPHFLFGSTAWEQSFTLISATVIFVILLIMLMFKLFVAKSSSAAPEPEPETKQTKQSFMKSFSYLAKSKYLICIAIIVVTYNMVINLIEVIWKNQVMLLYPNPSDYNSYMGQVTTAMGIFATIIAIFFSGNLLRKFTWSFTALITPIAILASGIAFFYFLLFKDFASSLTLIFGLSPLVMNVFFGSLQNCISRACKYTVFDATKEIAFIPLSPDSKRKGKAAIDGVGSRLGKSGGSVIHQTLLISCSTIAAIAPYVAGIFLIISGVWIAAAVSLGKQFNELITNNEKISIEEKNRQDKALAGS